MREAGFQAAGAEPPMPMRRQDLDGLGPYCEPTTPTEVGLTAIWASVLELDVVGVDDDFFRLGGTSLRAAEIFARIESAHSKKLPLSVLYEASTIAQLAPYVAGTSEATWTSLVPIRSSGERTPLFAVPGIGGNVVGLADLADALGPELPFFGLQSHGLDGRAVPFERIEDNARTNVIEVKKVWPNGPYYLFGACWGSLVAYEMAQQLSAEGRTVALLTMLDPPAIAMGESLPAHYAKKSGTVMAVETGRVLRHLRNLRGLTWSARWSYVREKATAVRKIVEKRDLVRHVSSGLVEARVRDANVTAATRYKPVPYEGAALLFLSRGQSKESGNNIKLEWAKLCRPCAEIFEVSGSHSGDSARYPHVTGLATKLLDSMDQLVKNDAVRK